MKVHLNGQNDTILVEGCNEGVFTLFRADSSTEEEVFFSVSGTATEGADYLDFPETAVFLEGEFAVEIPIFAEEDGITEGPEDITLSYSFVNTCGDTVTSSASLWMVDHIPPDVVPEDLILYCGAGYIELDVIQGYPDYSWEWENTETGVISTQGFLYSI